jgi:SAM-dependent methyltransferase
VQPTDPETEMTARRAEREAAREEAHARGETSALRVPTEGLSTPSIVRAVVAKIREVAPELRGDYLDIGAGNGELIDRVIRQFPLQARACDYRDDLMTLGGVQVDVVDLNSGRLPYENDSLDLVTCTEVIEHLEHHRPLMREIHRILRPGGICVLSTPNVLNLRSRLRYLFFGFFNMFGPLHLGDDRHHSTHGHINPVSYFYLAHSLSEAGFRNVSVSVDKMQRRSWFALALLWLPIRLFTAISLSRERHKYRTLDECNEPFVRRMNSLDLLLGRTVVIGCRKG